MTKQEAAAYAAAGISTRAARQGERLYVREILPGIRGLQALGERPGVAVVLADGTEIAFLAGRVATFLPAKWRGNHIVTCLRYATATIISDEDGDRLWFPDEKWIRKEDLAVAQELVVLQVPKKKA